MSTILERTFWRDSVIKTAKTAAQTAAGMLSSGALGILDVDWVSVASVSGLSGVACLLWAIAQSDGPKIPDVHDVP